MSQPSLSAFIWSLAGLLHGNFRAHDYGKVILPFIVLRRLDCVLGPTKAAVLKELAAKTAQGVNPEPFLRRKAGLSFFNQSPLDLPKLLGDPALSAHTTMSKQALDSAKVRQGLKDILLGPVGLYEALRSQL